MIALGFVSERSEMFGAGIQNLNKAKMLLNSKRLTWKTVYEQISEFLSEGNLKINRFEKFEKIRRLIKPSEKHMLSEVHLITKWIIKSDEVITTNRDSQRISMF